MFLKKKYCKLKYQNLQYFFLLFKLSDKLKAI